MPLAGFGFLRLLVAFCVLAALVPLLAPATRARPAWTAILQVGLAQAAFQICFTAGVQRTSAANSALLLATSPLIATLWLALRGRANVSARQWSGLGLGLLGIGLLVHTGSLGFERARIVGDLFALASAAAWAWYSVALGPLVTAAGSLRATAWGMAVAAACFLPFAAGDLVNHDWLAYSHGAWGGLVYSATLGMVISMVLWGRAVGRLGPRQTIVYVYLEPVSAIILAALIIGEPFGWAQALGAAVTFAAIWLAS